MIYASTSRPATDHPLLKSPAPKPRKQPLPAHGQIILASLSNADMMSDMKTFTVRELDRSPATVLAACDRDGEARISHRDGRAYRILPEAAPARFITSVPDFAARRRKLFPKPLPASFARKLDQMIRGE